MMLSSLSTSPRRRCRTTMLLSVLMLVVFCASSSFSAPMSHKKKYYIRENSIKRAERRYMPPSSPIHFINPFMSMPPALNPIHQFLAAPPPPPPPIPASQIFKLPLRLFSNAKPFGIMASGSSLEPGFVPKPNVIDFLPHAVANVIRLPLKFVSNAKPIGVYFKNPAYNFL